MLSALADSTPHPPVLKLAVKGMPISGEASELMHAARIDADAIVAAVDKLATQRATA